MTTRVGPHDTPGSSGTQVAREGVALAVNAYFMADKAAQEGDETAVAERSQHLRVIQGRYWRMVQNVFSGNLARRRQGIEFSDDERLLMDVGLVDVRMLGGDCSQALDELLAEINYKGLSVSYYFSEWLAHRQQQLQMESTLTGGEVAEDDYASQLMETRRRVLSRLSDFFAGLPGVPLELSESMRSGELDNAVIAAGIAALREPRRKNFLRRRNLWNLREQILAKARARTNSQNALRLFEMLNEIYARDWRERYDAFVNDAPDAAKARDATSVTKANMESVSVGNTNVDILMSEIRQMRMRMVLMSAVDGMDEPDIVLHAKTPRLTKRELGGFLHGVQAFDRQLAELPPIVIVPGAGRGFFAWETGCVMLALRPLVGIDDSIATAFAWQRMLEDRFNNGCKLRLTYEQKFPGAVFHTDFPADYRAWLTRLTKGEVGAMPAERRAFFRDHIGPDVSGPLLPPNLRNLGPQTMVAISRRLEKQLAAGDNDVNLHRRLAALYWQQGNMEAAGLQFNAAMQLAPDDGETMFAAGLFMRGQGDIEAANDCFRFGAERARDSLWGIYCQDALAGQI